MQARILVPLDGSELSESALRVAIPYARWLGARLETITVFEPPLPPSRTSGAPPLDRRFDAEMRAAHVAYVDNLTRRLPELAPDLATEATYREGPVAETIAGHAKETGASLIVMSTHGRSGPSRFWLGSVADRLTRIAETPLMLLRDHRQGHFDEAAPFGNVIVPIDGSPESLRAIDTALAVLGTGPTYHLLHVVTPMPLLPQAPVQLMTSESESGGDAPDLLGTSRDSAALYLQRLAEKLRDRIPRVVTRVEVHERPAEAIVDYAAGLDAPLVAMATHGRGAVGRLLLGSVTDKVVRAATVPVLIQPPAGRRSSTRLPRLRRRTHASS